MCPGSGILCPVNSGVRCLVQSSPFERGVPIPEVGVHASPEFRFRFNMDSGVRSQVEYAVHSSPEFIGVSCAISESI